MHSSTSSSSERAPEGRWASTWALALVLALAALATVELSWRASGFEPEVVDDADLWTASRRLVGSRADSVVFAGTSSVMVGIDLDAFRAEAGMTPVQLAINGTSPIGVLRDLADDDTFRGLLVCGIRESFVFGAKRDRNRARLRAFIARHRAVDESPGVWAEHHLSLLIDGRAALRAPRLRPIRVLSRWAKGESPPRSYQRLRRDRFRPSDYSHPAALLLLERKRRRAARAQRRPLPPIDVETVTAVVEELDRLAQRIADRGGRVVFLRMPGTTHGREGWDLLATGTAALTVHFQDYAELSRFSTADGAHLDYRDAAPFTRALVGVLRRELSGAGDQRLAAR